MRSERSVQLFALSAMLAMDPMTGGLNPLHLRFLASLCEARLAFSIVELAARHDVSQSVASRVVDRLHRHGLVSRAERATNRTVMDIRATKDGLALNKRVQRFLAASTPAIAQAS
jgi:DNA-binding MarR family transcriptional regulator